MCLKITYSKYNNIAQVNKNEVDETLRHNIY